MSLIAEQCKRRGITIEQWPEGAWDQALARVLRQPRKPGIIRLDVSGRITGNRTLAVSKVHRVEFLAMSEKQESAFWRSKGF